MGVGFHKKAQNFQMASQLHKLYKFLGKGWLWSRQKTSDSLFMPTGKQDVPVGEAYDKKAHNF